MQFAFYASPDRKSRPTRERSSQTTAKINPMVWKLRRVAAGMRQQDLAGRAGMATTRYSAIERGELEPTSADVEHIKGVLPHLSPELEREVRMAPSP